MKEVSTKTVRIIIGALLGSIAFILQSAGVFTGIGFLFSMMSTFPIVLSCYISLRIGFMSYLLTIILLTILQPSELLIFSFTTGLLGISLGAAIRFFKRAISIVLAAGLALTMGIATVLYGFQFPILGPAVATQVNRLGVLMILLFSVVYSWIWLKMSTLIIKRIKNTLPQIFNN